MNQEHGQLQKPLSGSPSSSNIPAGLCPQIKQNSAFMFAKSKSKQKFLRT